MMLQHRIEAGEILVVELREVKLDASNAHMFTDAVKVLVQRWHKVVLDLSGLNYIDGKGMSALLACLRLIQENRGIVRLCELSKNMTALFKMMRIHRAYKIHLSCADAVSSLQSLQY